MKTGSWTNSRGIALLIVLLVTALLIALIFEFAYATRISLNSAVNFRDSQRAYFLARAGVYAFIKYKDDLIKHIPQDEWWAPPYLVGADTQVLIKWQDEQGKLGINSINNKSNPAPDWIDKLFSDQGVETSVYDAVVEMRKERSFVLIADLHAVMSDEDYRKVARFLSVYSDNTINFNTAPAEVFIAMGCNGDQARSIIELRNRGPLDATKISIYLPPGLSVGSSNFPTTITKFTVYSRATVGGYTKEIVAIIGSDQPYWRAL